VQQELQALIRGKRHEPVRPPGRGALAPVMRRVRTQLVEVRAAAFLGSHGREM
jgi:hypothetical protein